MTDETHVSSVSRSVTGMSRVCVITRHLSVTSTSRKSNGTNYVASFCSVVNCCAHRTRLITFSLHAPAELDRQNEHDPAPVNVVYEITRFDPKREPASKPRPAHEKQITHCSKTSGIPHAALLNVT